MCLVLPCGCWRSHPTRGEWIEIQKTLTRGVSYGLTPPGVSGLKFRVYQRREKRNQSHPTRGEWIEMGGDFFAQKTASSHPTRGEWIEITVTVNVGGVSFVSPHPG